MKVVQSKIEGDVYDIGTDASFVVGAELWQFGTEKCAFETDFSAQDPLQEENWYCLHCTKVTGAGEAEEYNHCNSFGLLVHRKVPNSEASDREQSSHDYCTTHELHRATTNLSIRRNVRSGLKKPMLRPTGTYLKD